ncbi:MAG: glycosyltransferase, partial [Kiloniellales bacterium]
LVPVDDAAALARAIGRLIDEPETVARIAAGGRARYRAEFTEEVCVARYLELFRRLLAERAQSRKEG